MKKIITLVLALAMAVSLFTGCGKKNNAETGESDPNKLSVVTTIFPEYDWVREILGGKAESTDLTMLLDNGVDLHSYQPTADDIVKISDCDLFIYVGGESDGWAESVLKNAGEDYIVRDNLPLEPLQTFISVRLGGQLAVCLPLCAGRNAGRCLCSDGRGRRDDRRRV